MNTVIIWDIPTRIFHWTLVCCFAGLFITGDSERWRDLHVLLGYTVAGLLGFRILWGFLGSRYARFGDFLKGPGAVKDYLCSLWSGKPERHAGHNPAGGVAIILLIGLGVLASLTGWLLYEDIGGELMEELHELTANGMLALVALHVLGVLASSWRHRENLILAMVTGRKRGAPGTGISRSYPLAGALLLAGIVAFWTGALIGQDTQGAANQNQASERFEAEDDDGD